MHGRSTAVSVLVLSLAVAPAPAEAWGFEAHRFIMDRAISLLPLPIRPFFETSRAVIVERAIDPDLWRLAGFDEENLRHFVNLDAYGHPPFKDLQHDFEEAVRKHGRDTVEKNGLLPWRVEEIYRKLVEAFRLQSEHSREHIRFFSAVLAHYVADAHVPFHATSNSDGHLTQQWGIHARFETDLFERYRNRLRITPRDKVPVSNPRDFIFDTLTGSHSYVEQVLGADRHAVQGRDVYDDGYYGMFFGKARPALERRLSESITAVASMISAAWAESGRPRLGLQESNPPKKVRRH